MSKAIEILDRKAGRFGWEIFLVKDSEDELFPWKIGLVDSKGEFYHKYADYDTEEFARFYWEKFTVVELPL